MKKIATFCPIFPGFYESHYMHSYIDISEIDYFKTDFDTELNEKEKDFVIEEMWRTKSYDNSVDMYRTEIIEKHCEVVSEKIADILECECEILNPVLWSPKYYNYETDSINCNISIDLNKVLHYIKENKDQWVKFCKDRYTPYDGFIPHYDTNEVIELTEHNLTIEPHFLGTVLEFILINEEMQDDVIREVLESVYYSIDFDGIIEELKEEIEELD
jgi:hypothetical protein